jgi:hypothetical protein
MNKREGQRLMKDLLMLDDGFPHITRTLHTRMSNEIKQTLGFGERSERIINRLKAESPTLVRMIDRLEREYEIHMLALEARGEEQRIERRAIASKIRALRHEGRFAEDLAPAGN